MNCLNCSQWSKKCVYCNEIYIRVDFPFKYPSALNDSFGGASIALYQLYLTNIFTFCFVITQHKLHQRATLSSPPMEGAMTWVCQRDCALPSIGTSSLPQWEGVHGFIRATVRIDSFPMRSKWRTCWRWAMAFVFICSNFICQMIKVCCRAFED